MAYQLLFHEIFHWFQELNNNNNNNNNDNDNNNNKARILRKVLEMYKEEKKS